MKPSGITYFKLDSGYEGDRSLGRGLTNEQVDNNFYFLRGRDIEEIGIDDDGAVYMKRTDGSVEKAADAFPKMKFEYSDGRLRITSGDDVQEVDGFYAVTETDATLKGDGSKDSPVGLSPVYMTGVMKPVKAIIDFGGSLPENPDLGDRYLVKRNSDVRGLYYTSSEVSRISERLDAIGSRWRVPTDNDWKDAIDVFFREGKGSGAGNAMKAINCWRKTYALAEDGHGDYIKNDDGTFSRDEDEGIYEFTELASDSTRMTLYPTEFDSNGDGEYAFVWSADTNGDIRSVKSFSYDRDNIESMFSDEPADTAAIRLVREYNGHNFARFENIGGKTYRCTLMKQHERTGGLVWMAENLAMDMGGTAGVPMEGHDRPEMFHNGYFIVEWDGREWAEYEMSEGECVVAIKTSPDSEANDVKEWKVKNGELVSSSIETSEGIGDIVDSMKETIDALNRTIDSMKKDLSDVSRKLETVENNSIVNIKGKSREITVKSTKSPSGKKGNILEIGFASDAIF